ncbi:MAG: hypothetical protein ACRBFS_09660 [Aureispira sp.]
MKLTTLFPFLGFLFLYSCQQAPSTNTITNSPIDLHSKNRWLDQNIPAPYKIEFDVLGDLTNDQIEERVLIYNTGHFFEVIENDSFFLQ